MRPSTTKPDVGSLKLETVNRWATGFAVVGLVAAVTTTIGTFYKAVDDGDIARTLGTIRLEQAERLSAENRVIKGQLASLKREVAIMRPSRGATTTSEEVAKLSEAVSELAKRQKRIEDAISRDPARALEVPLLRRDLDNIKETHAQAVEAMTQRINQVFDLNKWLLGGGALSLLSIALSIVLSRLKARAES